MKVVNALIAFEKRDTRFTFGLTCDKDDNDEYDYNNYINSKDNIIRSLRIEFIRYLPYLLYGSAGATAQRRRNDIFRQ